MIFAISHDAITPRLSAMLKAARDKRPVLQAMGTTFMSITMGTFNSVGASYRPVPWPAKKDGTPSILQKSTTMAKAFHLEVTSEAATLYNSMPYASIHQFGGKTGAHKIVPRFKKALAFNGRVVKSVNHPGSNIPARPFYPVENGKLTTKAETKIAAAGARELARQFEAG